MAPNNLRTLVWESLFGADYASRYYGYLARRLAVKDRAYSLVLTLLTSGAFLVLLLELDIPKAAEIIAFFAAGLSLFLTFQKYSKAAQLSAAFHKRWSQQSTEYEGLWQRLDELDPEEILGRWTELSRREAEINEFATVEFSEDGKLQRRCYEEVARVRRLPEAA